MVKRAGFVVMLHIELHVLASMAVRLWSCDKVLAS